MIIIIIIIVNIITIRIKVIDYVVITTTTTKLDAVTQKIVSMGQNGYLFCSFGVEEGRK